MAMNPARYPQTKTRRGRGGNREDLGRYFRSSWEANYARYLNFLVAAQKISRWEYEPKTFEFQDIKRGSRFYTPDFRVWDFDGGYVWHEVKGYMDARSATKLKRFAKRFAAEKLVVIGGREYREIELKVSSLIPGWEGRR